jgi:hypothetical protein
MNTDFSMRITRALVLTLLALAASRADAQRTHSAASRRDRISPEEVQRSTATDAFQLVQSLRPQWLSQNEVRLATAPVPPPRQDPEGPIAEASSRAVQAQAPQAEAGDFGVIIVLDNALLGGREELRGISLNRVRSLEFLPPARASLRFGRRARDGAIVVHTLAEPDADRD